MTTEADEAPGRLNQLLIGLAVLTALVVFVQWPGCRQYPPVTSEEGLKLIKLLYTACNTQDATRLAQVETRLAQGVAAGKVSAAEETAMRGIIAQAQSGAWAAAEQASLRFAQDQIGQGKLAP